MQEKDVMNRTNSMGLWTYAHQFIQAARAVANKRSCWGMPVPAYYLVCHGIELALKAYLRGAGWSVNDLKRRIGHDLSRCLDEEEKQGLANYCNLSNDQRAAIHLANIYYYCKKEFEYITTGYKALPEFECLMDAAEMLLDKLRTFCFENWRRHEDTVGI